MAVTKTQPAETVALAARAGIVRFGENRVQEGVAKIAAALPEFPGLRMAPDRTFAVEQGQDGATMVRSRRND